MTGLGSSGAAEIADARRLQIEISKECCQVGLAQKYQIEPIKGLPAETWADADKGDVYEELDAKFLPDGGRGDWKSSMSQDVSKGRRTEIEFMNGFIAREGNKAGIPTPVNAAITSVVAEIDMGIRLPEQDNIREVMLRAGIS